MLADALVTPPDGLAAALAVVDGLDDALVHGLSRVDDERAAGLETLAAAFAASPPGERIAEAVGKIIAGTVTDEHLLALAGARLALLAAAHDALLAQLDAAVDRHRDPLPLSATNPPTGTPPTGTPAAGCLAWLRELAIAGWRGVDRELASAAAQNVQVLLPDPAQRRLAVLLDGFAAELQAAAPVAGLPRIPVRRWADLWSRALVLAQPTTAVPVAATPVDGRLLILGVDLHEHPTSFRAQVHGLLERSDGVRLVRTSVAAPKVDTITGPSAWRMLAGFPVLLGALARGLAVEVTGMLLTPAGDLLWDEVAACTGDPADPFAVARVQLAGATASATPPLDRHPAVIAEPVLLQGYLATEAGFELGGHRLPVMLDRLPAAGPLTPALVHASTACLGLLRWDRGHWAVQPLAVQATQKKKTVAVHTADWALGPTEAKAAKAEAAAGTAVAVLRERAGRLLRS